MAAAVWYRDPLELVRSLQLLPQAGKATESANALMRSGLLLALVLLVTGAGFQVTALVVAASAVFSYAVSRGAVRGTLKLYDNDDDKDDNNDDDEDDEDDEDDDDDDNDEEADDEDEEKKEKEGPEGGEKAADHVFQRRVSSVEAARRKLDGGMYAGLRTDPRLDRSSFASGVYSSPSTWGVERQFQSVDRTSDPVAVAEARNRFARMFHETMEFRKDQYTPRYQPDADHRGVTSDGLDTGPSANPNAGMNTTTLGVMYSDYLKK